MVHPLVEQLRFARTEFLRGLDGLSNDEARRRIEPMNSISWNVGHMAWQEQRYWLFRGQGRVLVPEVQRAFASGGPASTPPMDQVLPDWRAITTAADPWLDQLTSDALAQPRDFELNGQTVTLRFGTMLQRTTYHYWYHTGENLAIRQMLGHTQLPEFVGDIDHEAPYRPEADQAVAATG